MPIASGIQPNIFRAVSGSLFSSPVNWSRGVVPTGSDVAMIADNCTIDISRTLGSLVVRAPFTASVNSGLTLNVSQSFLINGHINFLGGATVFLSGKYNEITGITPGLSTFIYRGETEQLLPGGPYYNLQTSWYDGVNIIATNKKSTSNLVINGSLQINYAILELGKYDYYCSGSTNINGGLYAILSKNQPGNIIFNGALKNSAAGYPINFINFSNGNPTIEVRNGIDLYQYNILNTGKGTWRFTTNNQNIYNTAGASTITFDGPISIENINLSILANASTVTLNDVINGTTPTSQLITSGTINFNTLVSLNSMTTGSFNFTSSNSTIGFTGNYSATIPSRFNVLRNAVVSGTGIKTLATSSYVSGTLNIFSNGILQLSSSNLVVSGASNIVGNLSKSGLGSVTFYNSLTGPILANSIDFSVGNPTVEFRNGFTLGTNHDFNVLKTGTGSWIFTTNNQTIRTHEYFGFYTSNFDAPIIVSGAIDLNIRGHFYLNKPFNGTSVSSKITNSGIMYINFTSSLMPTGTFDYLSTSSILGFTMPESYTIPLGSYRGLFISGSGIKYTSGSINVSGSLTIAANSQLELGNYDLTVTGSVIPNLGSLVSSKLTKSGSGNVIFNGILYVAAASRSVDFSLGNPTVECRGGIYAGVNNVIDCLHTGTGSWIFTTNNQVLQPHIFSTFPYSFIFDAPLIISGAISVTANSTYNAFYMSRSLNGTEAASKFINNGVVYYYASQQPMLTGSADFSSSLTTTFLYASGSQNVRGGIYRNLTFLNGLKTLQGNVSVLGTFSTGSGATSGSFNLNGFTLTNP